MPCTSRVALALVLFATLSVHPVAAQQSASVYGWVQVAESGEPVEAAEVQVVGSGRASTTDANGFFALADLVPGTDTLVVRHLGYTDRRVPIEIVPDRSIRVLIEVAVDAIPLDPIDVEVRGSFRTREIRDFQRRREIRSGRFFTERELEGRGGSSLGFFLQGLPSVRVQRDGAFGDLNIEFRGRRCVPRVWIDGREVKPAGAALHVLGELKGSDLETLELYRGTEAPLELAGPCLTVVALTKRGG